jgi:hypothetical protein
MVEEVEELGALTTTAATIRAYPDPTILTIPSKGRLKPLFEGIMAANEQVWTPEQK